MPDSPAVQPPAAPPLLKLSPSCLACPVLLRAALQGEGGRRRCCCSAAAVPVVTDLEYDALIMGQPPQSHQMLVVCVTPPHQPVGTASESGLDVLDQLYRRMNVHRTAPCTQVQTLFLFVTAGFTQPCSSNQAPVSSVFCKHTSVSLFDSVPAGFIPPAEV